MNLGYLFWGYLAGLLLLAGFVGLLASRIGKLEKRLTRSEPPR